MATTKQTTITIDTQSRRKRYSKETLLTFAEQNRASIREVHSYGDESIIIVTDDIKYWFNLTKSGNYNLWSAVSIRREPPKPEPKYFKVRAFFTNSDSQCADLVKFFDTLTDAITFVDGLCQSTYERAEVTNERSQTLYSI